jgi:hypothetical protein
MKNKNLFIIITPIFFVILLISIFYLLFFRDLNLENSNNNLDNEILIDNNEIDQEGNEKNTNSQQENNEENLEEPLAEVSPDFGLNIEIDGFKYCRYDEECFANLFLNCNIGNHINFIKEDLPYTFSILSKNDDYCFLLIQNLSSSGSENINCSIPLNLLNNENFNKILELNSKVLNSYCE